MERARRRDKGLTTKRASLGVVPVQNRNIPSSVNMRYAQWKELRYCDRASKDCMRVLMTLKGLTATKSRKKKHFNKTDLL
jgi:hypothetical protein